MYVLWPVICKFLWEAWRQIVLAVQEARSEAHRDEHERA